jgi:hypothetical protein
MTFHHMSGEPTVRPMAALWHPCHHGILSPFTSDGAADFSLNQESRTDLLRVGE